MDSLCLKAGIQSMVPPPISAAAGGDLRPSISTAQPRHSPWGGFTFRHPLRSFWPVVKTRCEPAISAEDAVLMEDKDDGGGALIIKERDDDDETRNGNWVFKILHVTSLWRDEGRNNGGSVEEEEEEEAAAVVKDCGGEDHECEACTADDGGEEEMEFDSESFSKLLKKVPLAEARLYARMSSLGGKAYNIPAIKPRNLLRNHGLRFVTSSIEKREQASKAEKEKESIEEKQKQPDSSAEETDDVGATNETQVDEEIEKIDEAANGFINPSSAYQIAASAASYLQSHTKSILWFKPSSNPEGNDNSSSDGENDINHQEMSSLMATTDSVTSVVAAKEEVKQAVADDLSTHSSPCEWFVCDDDKSATRFFVIQGSESLASWQANLLFEPVQFEGLDFLVHRGIYEAAKGIYEQMLPEIQAHLESRGESATFRFTGHSLGGSLSLLVNLMLLIRGDAPRSSLLPVVTFGAPSIMCGGNELLRVLGLPQSHIRSIAMHRDIVPRAFSCNYPTHVAEFLKAVNGNFRNHPCLNKQNILYPPMGEFLILQPDEKFSPSHDLLPSGSGLYVMACPGSDPAEAEKQIRAAQAVFMNSPHPLEMLKDRGAYGYGGAIMRDHDIVSYTKSVRTFIRREIKRVRKARREHRRRVRWSLVAAPPRKVDVTGSVVNRRVGSGSSPMSRGQFNVSGIVGTGRESLKRLSSFVASQQMHLLVVLLLPARLLGVLLLPAKLLSYGLTNMR